jgi:signal transduction histidine kinase
VSLRALLLGAFAYVLVLVLVALGVPLGSNLSRRVDAEVKAQAASQAQLIAATAAGRLRSDAALQRIVRRAGEQVNGRVIVVDARGRLLADSAGSGLRFTDYGNRPELVRALRGETAQGSRFSTSLNEELLYTAVPILRGARSEGAVRVTQSIEAVRDAVERNLLELAAVGLGALLLGLGAAWLLAGWLSRPLRALAAAARRISGGELDHRAEVRGSTEQRELAAAFNDMTDRLSRALAAQREFVANASHQLRTPLTGLRLRIESAAIRAEDERLRRDLEAAEAETERLATLLADLLRLARGSEEPSRAESVSLSAVAESARERWAAPAEQAGHALRLEGDEDVWARSSSEDLAVALDHLIDNALKYSPSGGRVSVGWGPDGPTRVRLTVSDEGTGLADEEREHVFDRFYRGRQGPDGPTGTGLGLSIVETLARRWGGEARLVNRERGGTRAELVLPAATDSGRSSAGSSGADGGRGSSDRDPRRARAGVAGG